MTAPVTTSDIANVEPVIGMEVHVELATRTKMFTRVASPAALEDRQEPGPNSLIDPTVLALPGSLPVMNRAAVELSMMVGLALGCRIPRATKWDRKSYFYPDMPKAYQVSQYDLPLCIDGALDVPAADPRGIPDLAAPPRRIRIRRAHLEEDAGKLLHEAPGGHAIDFSIVDYNRAGTPLLEIVTEPDMRSSAEAVLFARLLRQLCRWLGATHGVMQKGHMRFEPNINCVLTLRDGKTVRTPIVEVKNLNSFRSLKGAIDFELAHQPARFLADGRVMGPGTKSTRGWDDTRNETFAQRDKEDAHDYRYFPDPDLVPVSVDDAWKAQVASRIPELPMARFTRYTQVFGVGTMEAFILVEERAASDFYDRATDAAEAMGIDRNRAGRTAANILLQSGQKRANERSRDGRPVLFSDIGICPQEVGALTALRERAEIGTQAVDELFGALCDAAPAAGSATLLTAQAALQRVELLARAKNLLIQRDDNQLAAWVAQTIAANPKAAEDVRAGKLQAAGRLVGEVMKLAGGAADAKSAREAILKALGQA